MVEVIPSKTVPEVITLTFEFVDQITYGQVLINPVITIEVLSGSDSLTSLMHIGSPVIDGTTIVQQIGQGLPGVVYKIICTVGVAGGYVYTTFKVLAVLSDIGAGFGVGRGLYITGDLPDTFAYVAYYELLTIHDGYEPFGPVTVYSGNYPIGWTPTIDGRYIVTSGIANDTGTFTFTYKLVDFAGQIAYSDQVVYIPPVDIYGSIPTIAYIGVEYAGQFDCRWGMPAYTFAYSGGTPVPGLVLSSTTCIFSSQPTQSGVFTFDTGVTDDIAETDEITWTITVYPALTTRLVNSSYCYGGTLGTLSNNGYVAGITHGLAEPCKCVPVGFLLGEGSAINPYYINPVTGNFTLFTTSGGFLGIIGDFSPDGAWLVTVSAIYRTSITYRVYQRSGYTYTLISTQVDSFYVDIVQQAKFSPDGNTLMLSYKYGTTEVPTLISLNAFNQTTGVLTIASTYTNFGNYSRGYFIWHPNGNWICRIQAEATPTSGSVLLYRTSDWTLLSSSGNAGSANREGLCFDRLGSYLYSSSHYNGGDYGISIFSVSGSGILAYVGIQTVGLTIETIDISPDNNWLAAAKFDGDGHVLTYERNLGTGTLTYDQSLPGGGRWASWVIYE